MPSPTTLDGFTKEFRRLQRQKRDSGGGVEVRTLVNLLHDAGEHQTYFNGHSIIAPELERNKVHANFNLASNRKRKVIGRLSAINPEFRARADSTEYSALSGGQMVDKMTIALDQKLDQPERTRELFEWMTLGGAAYEFTPWVPDIVREPMPVVAMDLEEEDMARLLEPPMDEMELIFEIEMPDGPKLVGKSAMDMMLQTGQVLPEQFTLLEQSQLIGEVGSFIFGPLNLFLDHSIKAIAEIPPGMSVTIATVRTEEYLKEAYKDTTKVDFDDLTMDDVRIVSTRMEQIGGSLSHFGLQNFIPAIQGRVGPDDPPMYVHCERYNHDGTRRTCFIPGQGILFDDDSPYDDGIPIVDFHWSPVKTSHWTAGYFEDVVQANQYVIKRLRQVAEYSNQFIKSPRLLGPDLTGADVPTDEEGYVKNGLNPEGVPMVRHMDPPEIRPWFMQTIDVANKLFNEIAGGSDLFRENRFPGQMRGSMGLPLMQEILDTEWGPLYKHVAHRMAQVKQKRLERVRQFYPPVRTMHYVDRSMRDETLIFHSRDVLRSGVKYKITVKPGTIIPESRALREERIMTRLNGPLSGLYMDRRSGQVDWSKVAADIEFGDVGREESAAQSRKLAKKIIEDVMEGKPSIPPSPWMDMSPMLDEFVATMNTEEFFSQSPEVQQAMSQYWEALNGFLQQQAAQAAEGQQQEAIDNAVAQAAQQAAARAANEAVDAVMDQLRAQAVGPQGQDLQQLVMSEAQRAEQEM